MTCDHDGHGDQNDDDSHDGCGDQNDDDSYQDLIVVMGAKENGNKRQPHDASGVHCETDIPGR